jgi:hypothetical protein
MARLERLVWLAACAVVEGLVWVAEVLEERRLRARDAG